MNALLNKTDETTAKTPTDVRRALEARIACLQAQPVVEELAHEVALRENVADHVFAIMQKQDITQAELARRLGKSRAYICKILGGGANLTLDSLSALSTALECDLHLQFVPQNNSASTCTAQGLSEWEVERPRLEMLKGGAPAPQRAHNKRSLPTSFDLRATPSKPSNRDRKFEALARHDSKPDDKPDSCPLLRLVAA